jgi:signal transduction histidine kinase
MYFATPQPYAALVAFAALGANLLGTALLILLNPRSRAVRWHAAFMLCIIAWLGLQGWFTLGLWTNAIFDVYVLVVHMLGIFFLAAALVETYGISDLAALGVVVAGAAIAPFLNPMSGAAGTAFQMLPWGAGALLHFRTRSQRAPPSTHARGDRVEGSELVLKVVLLVIVPVAVIGVIALRGGFLLYAMPLITIMIQFLIFVGVVHHRFYDIEVRAARSSELAYGAAEQERLALLGEVSATLAHEIRNPLTGMRSLAQRLAGPAVDDERRARYAGVILGEVERLDRIAGNLLDIGRREIVGGAGRGPTPLEPLFDDLMLLVDSRARRAQVEIERDAGGLSAAAPRDALAQALLNLIINAVSHSPSGGRVRVSARPVEGGRLELCVADSGPGVPPEERERIFEPFHTRGLGAGLGLTVVRRLARELDWGISITDAPGGGASFHLRVPAA